MEIQPLHDDFGARVTGIDLSTPLDAEQADAVWKAVDDYSFVVFPNQDFDDEKHLAFTRALGAPEPSHTAVGKVEYFGTIGNVQPDGTVLNASHKKSVFLTGNNMWHSDASFKPTPAALSIMAVYETPDEGGETLFASGRSAYARLSPEARAEVDPLVGVHDYVYSRSKVAPDAVSSELAASLPAVRQKLVRRNPRHGARNLFIGSHVREIEGWDEPRSRAKLDELVDHATQPEHIYAHAWRPGEVAIWDNRCLVHRGAGYDADKYRRHMRQTRVAGVCSSLEE